MKALAMSLADFQAVKSHIVVPGTIFVEQALTAPHCKTLMVAKAPRRSASLIISRIRLWRIFFCFREAKSKPADLLLSQGGLMKNLEGVA
jgi:hypothetical protein